MAERKINPILKQVLELGPTILFFLVYMRIKDESYSFAGTEYSGFIVAALILVPLLLLSTFTLWLLTGAISRMQIFVAVMVIFFGGMTAWFNDERFFKMKTTIVYGTFAVILGIGLLRGRSLLQWVMADALPMKPEGWMIRDLRDARGIVSVPDAELHGAAALHDRPGCRERVTGGGQMPRLGPSSAAGLP
jgi:intracellular septation protein